MRVASRLRILTAFAIVACASAQFAQKKERPTVSEHQQGPQGLEGWTLNSTLPDSNQYGDERFAFTLVLARDGHILRKIEGDPIIWKWMFRADGRQVAYETGPLHFGMQCILADVETRHRVADFDCYHDIPDSAPEWVKTLDRAP